MLYSKLKYTGDYVQWQQRSLFNLKFKNSNKLFFPIQVVGQLTECKVLIELPPELICALIFCYSGIMAYLYLYDTTGQKVFRQFPALWLVTNLSVLACRMSYRYKWAIPIIRWAECISKQTSVLEAISMRWVIFILQYFCPINFPENICSNTWIGKIEPSILDVTNDVVCLQEIQGVTDLGDIDVLKKNSANRLDFFFSKDIDYRVYWTIRTNCWITRAWRRQRKKREKWNLSFE